MRADPVLEFAVSPFPFSKTGRRVGEHHLTAFPPGMRLLQQNQRRTFDRLEQLIRDGIEAGVFNDINPKLVAELIAMTAARLVDPSFQRKLGLNLAECYEELSLLLDHGLLPNKKSRAVVSTSAPDAHDSIKGIGPDRGSVRRIARFRSRELKRSPGSP